MTDPKKTRRRGPLLEDAILEAAWSTLAEEGYDGFTVDAVAMRAETSKPVIYRRWPSKVSLASSAVAHYIAANPIIVPDLGDVREETIMLLRKYADRTSVRATRLFFEMHDDMASEGESFTEARFREPLLDDIVRRGVERGEIDPGRVTRRILRMPPSLVLHDIMVSGRNVTDEAIIEIVDEIFLPLVRRYRAR